jgi:ketosteroid isomerase-like protein
MSANSPQACTVEFTAALIRRDIGSAQALLADDVVFFYSNGTAILGKEAFSSMMTESWKMVEDYHYLTLEPRWIAQSDAAAALIYGFEWSGMVRGAKAGGRSRGTRVFYADCARTSEHRPIELVRRMVAAQRNRQQRVPAVGRKRPLGSCPEADAADVLSGPAELPRLWPRHHGTRLGRRLGQLRRRFPPAVRAS